MTKIDYTKSGQKLQEQAKADPKALMRRQVEHHQGFLQERMPQLERWITGGVDARALVRFAVLDLSAPTWAGEKLRECSRESIFMGLLACAVAGLEPGSLKGEAFLVPFSKKATYMAGWKGYVKQARRSNEVRSISPQVVFEHDEFDLDLGSGMPPRHKPLLRGERGEIIGAYAVAKLVGSRDSVVSYEVEWMDRQDLDAIRRAAKRGDKESDAWKDWDDQMYRKSPIRRIAKRLPMGSDYYRGIAIEQAVEDGKSELDVLDVLTDGEASAATAMSGVAESMRAQVEAGGDLGADEAAEIERSERRPG